MHRRPAQDRSPSPDLLIVLGGAIGVYERDAYPFVDDEIALIRARLAAKRPTLGICLGAQLMAAALGAKVYPGSQGKEIGWAPVEAGKDAALYPAFVCLLAQSRYFLHWHGDTFELPPHARHLATTPRYPNQAFAIENYALGLQFHPEVTARGLERWYVGNACELANAKIDVARLREQSWRFSPELEVAARRFGARGSGRRSPRQPRPRRTRGRGSAVNCVGTHESAWDGRKYRRNC